MGSDTINFEAQLEAMRKIMEALASLNEGERSSVLNWVDSQVGRSTKPNTPSPSYVPGPAAGKREGTVSFLAQKLGANSCKTLLIAAAAHLTLFQGKDSFTRDELIACAKEARSWKSSYASQMATIIKRLFGSGELFEKSNDVFSMSDETVKQIETKLAA